MISYDRVIMSRILYYNYILYFILLYIIILQTTDGNVHYFADVNFFFYRFIDGGSFNCLNT